MTTLPIHHWQYLVYFSRLGPGCFVGLYQQIGENTKNSFLSQFISRRQHSDLLPVKPALAVTGEPFKFSLA
jgi:hypothetical protein